MHWEKGHQKHCVFTIQQVFCATNTQSVQQRRYDQSVKMTAVIRNSSFQQTKLESLKDQSEVCMIDDRDVGSISNLGGKTLRGHFFLTKKETLSKNKKGPSLLIAKSWGHVPPVPPGSYIYD